MNDKVQRTGMTVDQSGREAAFPLWPHGNASPQSWLGRLGNVRTALMQITQARHEQNRLFINAKAAGKLPTLPEPDVRTALARKQQRALAEAHHKVEAVAVEAAKARAALREKVFDSRQDGFAAVMGRQELRAHMLRLKNDEREQLMRRPTFRRAALEAEPELSGLPAALHDRLVEEEIQKTFGEEANWADEALEAAELVRETAKVARLAVEAELAAAGAPITEQPAAAPTPQWV